MSAEGDGRERSEGCETVRGFVAGAFLAACRAELAALKPGNVHVHAPGHGMEAATFERAALAAAPHVADAGARVGARILAATQASFAAAGCNANLGIVLLCVPLAAAFERAEVIGADRSAPVGRDALRRALRTVLDDLDAGDTAAIFAAIAHASPGGLGEGGAHDVRKAPATGILAAMEIAAGRDLIARQYATGFSDVFDIGLAALDVGRAHRFGHPALGPAFSAYLAFAETHPDSHVARKFGPERAETVRRRFARLAETLARTDDPERRCAAAAALDAALKDEGLNPGTSADCAVASLFCFSLAEDRRR